MVDRKSWMLVALVILALVAAPGCVTKKMFRKNVETTDDRITGVESGVEENEKRISDLRSETDDKIAGLEQGVERATEVGNAAMSRADKAQAAADRAARGRLLWEITLSDDRVKFSFDQADLSDEAKSALDDLASKVKGMDRAVYLEIEGHTDNIGSEDYNYQLGEQRAEAVMKYLAQAGGIPLHAMNVVSYGPSSPVADNDSKDGRAQNRRVVIRVLE